MCECVCVCACAVGRLQVDLLAAGRTVNELSQSNVETCRHLHSPREQIQIIKQALRGGLREMGVVVVVMVVGGARERGGGSQ